MDTTIDSSSNFNDSGFGTIGSSSIKKQLVFPLFESTPINRQSISRKRKSISNFQSVCSNFPVQKVDEVESDHGTSLNSKEFDLSSITDGNCFNTNSFPENEYKSCNNSSSKYNFKEISFHNLNSRKEKYKEDINVNTFFEKCTLEDVDLYESHNTPKKRKWDYETVGGHRKSNSAPGTPQRPDNETDHYLKKFSSLEFTPTKAIGTPERNKILYPQLIEVKPAQKPKSPQKLRKELKRISNTARKRLYASRDFVYNFTNVIKLENVIGKIFSYLDDSDLINVSKVSPLWRWALEADKNAFIRYKTHNKLLITCKENFYCGDEFKQCSSTIFDVNKSNIQVPVTRSPPISPARENFRRFTTVAAQLKSTQRLTKCLICSLPAVIEKGIAQCSKENCGYLWCIKCMSGSKTGPGDFNCICIGNRSPPSPSSDRSGLADISNIDSCSFYYLADDTHNSKNVTSGYYSVSDVEKSSSFNIFQTNDNETVSKTKNPVLCDRNVNVSLTGRRHSYNNISVMDHSAAIRRVKQNLSRKKDNTEQQSTSPQKIKVHALGSKQSKKNLRRLCF